MDDPPMYNASVSAPSGHAQSQQGPADANFIRSLKGILRLVAVVLSLITIICSAVGQKGFGAKGAAGWCLFVSIFTFLVFIVSFFLWLFRVLPSLTPRFPITFIEFVVYIVFGGFFLIGAIVAAAFGHRHGALIATSIFQFLATGLCLADAFFHHKYWMTCSEGPYICGKTIGGGGGSGGGGNSTARSSGHTNHAHDPYAPGPAPDFTPPGPDDIIGPAY